MIKSDYDAIIEVIYRFANGLDLKDWETVKSCFSESILTDYSDLRGDAPSIISSSDYVDKRRLALSPLKTQHLSSNHIVEISSDTATCHSQMVIYRRKVDRYFNTHCYYEHKLEKIGSNWTIKAIKQSVWWNEGDATIHSGAK